LYRRPNADHCLAYCRENGITPKGHCLNYDNALPNWLKEAGAAEIKENLRRRFAELSALYGNEIPCFEVTNEAFNDWNTSKSPLFRQDDMIEWSFFTARNFFTHNDLYINDYHLWDYADAFRWNRSPYFMLLERLTKEHVPFDGIGMQMHGFFPQKAEPDVAKIRYNPKFLFPILDLYQRFGKKMQLTEMTIPAYSASAEDEEVQAELIRNLYPIFFSRQGMEAIIYWNLVDGYAAGAEKGDMTAGENVYYGGLLRFDMTEKPAFKVVKDFFRKEWTTSFEAETKDDSVSFRGFYGEYGLTVVYNGKEYEKKLRFSRDANHTFSLILGQRDERKVR
ncbi:MAG: endo-1,4-beta-xylanase, partial [Clostridia bacterium]|nr:endo-1,4-beta-xylanase [Clostridia bacterium]